MAKIFVVFFNGIRNGRDNYAMPIFFETFISQLQKLNNTVFSVMHRSFNRPWDDIIPESLLNEIKNFNPDLIVLFNNNFYDISEYFDCPIVIYEVDSPLYYGNKSAVIKNPDRYKYFVPSSDSIEVLKQEYGVKEENILLIPFFTEIKAEKSEKLYNISFIGTKFRNAGKNCIHKFMEDSPTDSERKEYTRLLNEFQKDVFVQKEILFKDTKSDKIIKNFNTYDLTFLLSDYKRINILSCVSDFGLDIWGTPNWATDLYNEPYLVLNYHKEPMYSLNDNQFIYNSSKIGISVAHLQAKGGFPWRIFDIMASDACLVTEYHSDFSKYFPDVNIPYFSNKWEAYEQCKKILSDEAYRAEIVAKSQEVVNKNHRFINAAGVMEKYLNINLINNFGSDLDNNSKTCLLEELLPKTPANTEANNTTKPLKLKNKIRYKIWHHYNRILKQKGII